VVLRIESKEYPLRAVSVEDAPLCQRVKDAFRAKYGFGDRVVGFFFRSVPHIMRLEPRRVVRLVDAPYLRLHRHHDHFAMGLAGA